MTTPLTRPDKRTAALCSLAILALILVAGGCTSPSQQNKPASPVTVTQPDSNTILVTYPGSTGTSDLLELETTVTDSTGKSQTKLIGDRSSTMPLKFGATQTLTGTFSGNDHVLITGYFMDGSRRTILDTYI